MANFIFFLLVTEKDDFDQQTVFEVHWSKYITNILFYSCFTILALQFYFTSLKKTLEFGLCSPWNWTQPILICFQSRKWMLERAWKSSLLEKERGAKQILLWYDQAKNRALILIGSKKWNRNKPGAGLNWLFCIGDWQFWKNCAAEILRWKFWNQNYFALNKPCVQETLRWWG